MFEPAVVWASDVYASNLIVALLQYFGIKDSVVGKRLGQCQLCVAENNSEKNHHVRRQLFCFLLFCFLLFVVYASYEGLVTSKLPFKRMMTRQTQPIASPHVCILVHGMASSSLMPKPSVHAP